MTIPDASRVLGISRSSGYRAAHAGQLPVLRLGRRLLVPAGQFCEMLGITAAELASKLNGHGRAAR